MTGVEILAANEVVTSYGFSFITYIITIFLAVAGTSIISYFDARYPTMEDAITGAIIGLCLGAALGVIPAVILACPEEYETQYKVTISDEVIMNDFFEKYEIIDQEGKIYTVRERNE